MDKSILLIGSLLTCTIMFSCKGNKEKTAKIEDLPEQKPIEVTGMMQDTVEFPSADNLMIQAVVYQIDSTSPIIVLCHQAGFSDYEYAEIAPKLNAMGFNCMAINQRSGGDMDGHKNVTHQNAVAKNLSVNYKDALPDINAAVNYASSRWKQPVILWGSSYAASLSLKVAMGNPNVRSVITFSPIAVFDDKTDVSDYFRNYNGKPIFVTSTEKEAGNLDKLFSHLGEEELTFYFPETKGTHGSKALWSADPSHEYYWKAVTEFLNKQKNEYGINKYVILILIS